MNIKSFIGLISGETFQSDFTGQDGFVIVQPYEELQLEQSGASGNTITHE